MKTNKPDWTKPPIDEISPKFKFPKSVDQVLLNGIRLVSIDDDTQENVIIHILSDRGSYSEPVPGLVDVASKMLTRGTTSRSATDIFDLSESLGAFIKSGSSWSNSSLTMTGLNNFSSKYLEMITDCLNNSVFDENEFSRVIAQQTADISQNISDTNFLAEIALNYTLFKDHPYGHIRSGTEKSIAKIENHQCKDWYNLFKKSQLTFIIAGKYNKHELIDMIGQLDYDPIETIHEYPKVNLSKDEYIVIDKKDAPQSTLRIGYPTIDRHNDDFPTLQFANTIFGGYFMSRLNHNLRETKGYTYGVQSQIPVRKGSTNLFIHTNIGNQYIRDSINEIKKEMKVFAAEGITTEELSIAKQYILGTFARSYETISQQAEMLNNLISFDLELNYYEKFFNTIKLLTQDEVNNCIKKYFQPKGMIFSVAGDRVEIEKQISSLGELKFLNPEGEMEN